VREDPDNHSNEANVKNALMLKCINSAGHLKNKVQNFAAPEHAFEIACFTVFSVN
jgi:hypothetical protein